MSEIQIIKLHLVFFMHYLPRFMSLHVAEEAFSLPERAWSSA
jgi:hypothetical protein